MDTLHHETDRATPDDFALLAEVEDREAAADRLRAQVFPNLDHEIAIGIAHAIVGSWNGSTLDRFLTGVQ